MSAQHNINANQGSSLYLHFEYLDENGTAIDVKGWTAEMQVKRAINLGTKLLHITGSKPNSGITAGITGATFGLTGGISLHRNMGNTGGQTGGILLIAGATAMSFVPEGIHQYDMELRSPGGIVTRLVEGRFECVPEITT